MLEQALMQVSKISIRVSGRRDAFVNLDHMHALPWHLLTCEGTQHLPRSVTAADGHNETAALRYSGSSLGSDELRSLAGDCFGIGKYLNLHGNSWQAAPIRVRRSCSCSCRFHAHVSRTRSRGMCASPLSLFGQ